MTAQLISNPWIVCPKPNPRAQLRLFCFPCAGGLASAYNTWPNHLPPEVEICAVQLPGRGKRLAELPFTRLPLLIPALVSVLMPYLDIPFAFIGHSMGATLGFEIARQLRRQNFAQPKHLFVCSCPAPQTPLISPQIHQLPESAFIAELCHRYNAIPLAIATDKALMQLFLPSLRADFTMIDTYIYTEDSALECPITAFGGLQDGAVQCSDLANWRDQTCHIFNLQMFKGDHFFIHNTKSPFLKILSQHLQIVIGGFGR